MLGAMMTGVDRATGEQLDDVNIRYQINTFLIAGHETTSGLLSCTIYALLKHPDVLKKAYEEVDRVLGPDIDARPTYQQVTQLTYITQILKEALRLWPPAPAYRHRAAAGRDHRRQIQAEEEHLRHGAGDGAASRPGVWGPNPDAFDPENFSREAEAKRADQRLEAVRQRPARLHRPRLRDARGGAGDRHDPAALQADRSQPLPDASQGNADDQARRLQDQGAAARRQGPRRVRRPRSGGRRRLERGGAAGADPPGPQHAAAGALRLQPRHAPRNWRRGWPISPRSTALRPSSAPLDDYVGKLPEQGGVADLLRVLQWRAARQRHAIRQMARRRSAARMRSPRCATPCSAAATATGPRPISRCRAMIDEQLAAHGARSVYARGEGDARSDLDGQFEKWFAARGAGGDEGIRRRFELHAAAPTTRRFTRSSRWRRPPSMRSWRSAALRR